MSKLDELILEALTAQEKDILRDTEELGWFALAFDIFKGKLGWVTWLIMIVQTVMFFVGVYCAWQFFVATDAVLAIKWGISGAVMLLMGAMLKFSMMPQMQTNRVLRELKRVELLVLHTK